MLFVEIDFKFGIIFLYFYNCRHKFRPIGTHQYSQKLPEISLELNDYEILDAVSWIQNA